MIIGTDVTLSAKPNLLLGFAFEECPHLYIIFYILKKQNK